MQVDENDEITVEGKQIQGAKPNEVYLAFNKPVGLITSVDPNAHDNVIEHINYPERVSQSAGSMLLRAGSCFYERRQTIGTYHASAI